ncbi:MAG: hypothetical protein LBO65_04145 [Spirochaetaceae bacterium]|jgi:hypothetical protein|nr:hypothetical protein [Spirochaetaceae bacterium]
MKTRGILTIAIGRKFAIQARYLSISCMLHAPDIPRAVITDCPRMLEDYYDVVLPYKSEYGNPFASKTRLHLYTPFDMTLFLDADSLVVSSPGFCWKALEDSSFVYTGKLIKSGIWYFDVERTLKKTGFPWVPDFNSGMLLFKNDRAAQKVFDTACDFMGRPEEFHVPFFRGDMLPDEPFFALSFAQFGIEPHGDYGRFSRTLIGAEKITINTVKGIARFKKHGKPVFPMAVHFCGRLGMTAYAIEKLRLRLHFFSLLDRLIINPLARLRKIVNHA